MSKIKSSYTARMMSEKHNIPLAIAYNAVVNGFTFSAGYVFFKDITAAKKLCQEHTIPYLNKQFFFFFKNAEDATLFKLIKP